MALNFNAEPYNDDFDETKNYHRILFKPGYAVQARELTQLQTQLQDQIKKFGNHIFKDGTVILDGQRFIETDLLSVRIGATLFGNTLPAADIIGKTMTGSISGTQAIIKGITTEPGSGYVLVVKITSGEGFDDITPEQLTIVNNSITYTATINPTGALSPAMMFSVAAGIYYIKGKFVYSPEQNVIVDAASNTSSKNIGFTVNEVVVTAEDEETLLDNAQGTPNYAAPGADRFGVELILTSKNLDTVVDNFIEIARVVGGELVVNLDTTIYGELAKEFARRTFDESGNYTVKPWKIQIDDHPTDNTLFTVSLEPGKGYIEGYEFQTRNQTTIEVAKAREFEQVTALDTAINYGNYVHVEDIIGVFDTTSLESVSLKNSSDATIGTAKVRFLSHLAGNIGAADDVDTTAIYRMYLFDIVMNTGSAFGQVAAITSTTGSAVVNTLSLEPGTSNAFLSGTDAPGLVFPVGAQYIRTIGDENGASKTNYQIQRIYPEKQFGATGLVQLQTATSLERFVGSGILGADIINEHYHAVVTTASTGPGTNGGFEAGDVINFTTAGRSINVITAAPESVQSVDLNANTSSAFKATIIVTINLNAQIQKTKTLSTHTKGVITETLNNVVGGNNRLANASGTAGISDVYDIAGVYNIGINDGAAVEVTTTVGGELDINWNGVSYSDVTSDYVLDNGQRAEYYDHARLILTGSPPANTGDNLLVVYRNFSHDGVGFFSVDSYATLVSKNLPLPTFTDPASGKVYELRDCFDFRPRKADGGTSLSGAQLPAPGTDLSADYSYYMGRMDRILAMPNQTFLVKKGIAAIQPVLPVNDTNGMVLYELIIPPYTDSARDVSFKAIDNKRYTMRDIGKIDKRVQNLEYYTQLSLLEKQAKDTSIPDATLFEKFKQGIAVDAFTSQDIFAAAGGNWVTRRWGWWNAWFNGSNNWNSVGAQNYTENSIAEPGDLDFNAAIDPLNSELRAPFAVEHVRFDTTTLSNTEKLGELVTLSFSETPAINQSLATSFININPFDVIKFVGKLDLEPPFDNWIDVVTLPAVNKIVDVRIPDAEDRRVDNFTGSGSVLAVTNTSTSIATNVIGSATRSLGVAIVDVQAVPYIRQKTVIGIGKLFKPKSRLYPFVENVPVSADCSPLRVLRITPAVVTTQSATMNATKVVALSATNANIKVGQYVTGTYITNGTYVESVAGATVTLSQVATGSGSATLSFRPGNDLFNDALGVYESLSFTGGATAKTAILSPPTTANPLQRQLTVFDVSGTISNVYTSTISVTGMQVGKTYKIVFVGSTDFTLYGSANNNVGTTFVATSAGVGTGTVEFDQPVTVTGANGKTASVDAVVTEFGKGTAIVPDEFGYVGFEFQIPAGKFKTGERTVRLIDEVNNDTTMQTSFGEAKYTATGLLQSKQETILTTRTLQNQRTVTRSGYWYDPIAQSILIDPAAYPEGLFVSSVEVFFKTKSSTIPVTMQLRRMVNGYPESTPTIPFSETSLNPEQIFVSANASIATKFTFKSPVHLTPGEYAIVLLSNTSEYNVYVAEAGQVVVGGSRIVDKQPYTGSLFISQNASTWTADQNKDLTFRLNRAVFNAEGTALFEIQDPAVVTTQSATMNATTTVTLSAANASVKVGQYIVGTNVTTGTRVTAISGTTLTLSQAATGSGTATLSFYSFMDYYNLFINTATIAPPKTTVTWEAKFLNSSGTFDAEFTRINVDQDLEYVSLKRLLAKSYTTGNAASLILKATLKQESLTDAVSPAIDPAALSVVTTVNEINNVYTNEGNIFNTGSFVVGKLYKILDLGTTTNWNTAAGTSGVTYAVGSEFTAATIGAGNGVVHEVIKNGGDAVAKYISKPIVLADGFDASNLCVTLDINKPPNTDVKVYFRSLATEKSTPISSESWVEMFTESAVPSSTTSYDFREHRFFPYGAFESGLPVDSPIAVRFDTFQIKIVMLSSVKTLTPKCRDLRIIALDD